MLVEHVQPKRNSFTGRWEYELLHDVSYNWNGHQILVPRLYSYDGATIPWFAWTFTYTPFDPIVMLPALMHDWLYLSHQVPRDQADAILKQLLTDNGASSVRVGLIYTAVRTFGRFYWNITTEDCSYVTWLKGQLTATGATVGNYIWPVCPPP